MIHAVEHEERPHPPPRDPLHDPEYFDTNEQGPQSDAEPEPDEDEEEDEEPEEP